MTIKLLIIQKARDFLKLLQTVHENAGEDGSNWGQSQQTPVTATFRLERNEDGNHTDGNHTADGNHTKEVIFFYRSFYSLICNCYTVATKHAS